ncbi:MAG: 30S ribosomal protein S8 [Candidatus Omnitrophica bacterium]|nr:30S ribosomal protein S8 [Candidatus Omnitrophota bacterium]
MSVTDLIADQLTVLRNALMAEKKTAIIKKSGIIESIVEIMKREGFIEDYKAIEDNKQGRIKVYFKYLDNGVSVIEGLKRVSRPGLRHYAAADKVKSVMGGVGISIISTSKGLLTDFEAKKQEVGGEVICQIW